MRVGDINGYWKYEKERREFGRILNELINKGLEFSKGDYVNVIRCADCKHCGVCGFDTVCKRNRFAVPIKLFDYCSYGERGDNSVESDVT